MMKYSMVKRKGSILFITVFLMTVIATNTISYAAMKKDPWNIETVEKLALTNEGLHKLIDQFKKDEQNLKKANPLLYHYVNGIKLITENNFKEGHRSLMRIIEESSQKDNVNIKARALIQLIHLNNYYGDIGAAIDYGEELLDLAEVHDNDEWQMYGNLSIALGFYEIRDCEEATEYSHDVFNKAYKTNDLFMQGMHYMLMGNIMGNYHELDKALEYYDKAGDLFDQSTKQGLVLDYQVLNHLNRLFTENRITDREIDRQGMLKEIDRLIESVQDRYYNTVLLYFLYLTKAQVEVASNLTSEGIKSLERCIVENNKINHVENEIDVISFTNSFLARAYYANGNYKEAAELFEKVNNHLSSPSIARKIDDNITKVREFKDKKYKKQINILNLDKLANEKIIGYQQWVLILSFIIITILIGGFMLIIAENRRINALKKEISIKSITDDLTKVFNRGKIVEIFNNEMDKDSVVALMDIDDFKKVNDTYGHFVGDKVLIRVVNTIKETIRKTDIIGRYGGEEFIVIFKEMDFDEALKIVERIRLNIEELEWEEFKDLKITISIGVVKKDDKETDELFKKVDNMLYEAKRKGKNRAVFKRDKLKNS